MTEQNPITEAITEHWGSRCPDTEPGCPICDAWAAYDALATSAKPIRDDIIELAAKDREATLHNVFAALEQLGAIRPLIAGIAYDPRIIGAHREARQKIAGAIAEALEAGNVITMDPVRRIDGSAELHASLMIVLPAGVEIEPAGQEVKN